MRLTSASRNYPAIMQKGFNYAQATLILPSGSRLMNEECDLTD